MGRAVDLFVDVLEGVIGEVDPFHVINQQVAGKPNILGGLLLVPRQDLMVQRS